MKTIIFITGFACGALAGIIYARRAVGLSAGGTTNTVGTQPRPPTGEPVSPGGLAGQQPTVTGPLATSPQDAGKTALSAPGGLPGQQPTAQPGTFSVGTAPTSGVGSFNPTPAPSSEGFSTNPLASTRIATPTTRSTRG